MANRICLSIIVKNEAKVIRRCLASVKPWITHWAVVDTGSTDGTQDIIREELKDLPGTLIERPWVGFATNRQQALDLARDVAGSDPDTFAMFIDADEVLTWPADDPLAAKLTDNAYGIFFRAAEATMKQTWARTFLVRLSLPWRWKGEVHEFLDCSPNIPSRTMIVGSKAYVTSHTDGARASEGKRRRYSVFDYDIGIPKPIDIDGKYVRDVSTLKGLLEADPDNERYWFYLAQSYTGARDIENALACYQKRISLAGKGDGEEVFYSHLQIAFLKEARGDAWEEVAAAHLRAYENRPTRAEPLWALAVLHNDRDRPATAELFARAACGIPRPRDVLLVMDSVYEYLAADELAAALGRQRKYDEALSILEKLVTLKNLPNAERKRAQDNIGFIRGLQRAA